MKYSEFLASKIAVSTNSGFDPGDNIHKNLKPHQRDIVRWALIGGRRAIFAAFGLGKSVMQLEICRLVNHKESGRQLIIAPLGVRQEFKRDVKIVTDKDLVFVNKSSQVGSDGMYITNYESVRDGKLDVNLFNCVCLDEASVLRSYGSKTYQHFLTLFSGVKYRFVATATPSPNRYKELIHYAGFLGIMDTGEALTRFFQRDSTKANNLTLYPHKEEEFWAWLHSWAIFLQKPSDIGYPDDGYVLPKLHVFYHKVDTDKSFTIEKNGQLMMFRSSALSLQAASQEKAKSLYRRVEQISSILYNLHNSLNLKKGANNVIREEKRISQEILPEKQRKNDCESEATKCREKGRTKVVQERILRKKQGKIITKTKNTKQKKLSRKQRTIQKTIKRVEGEKPRKSSIPRKKSERKKQRTLKSIQESLLPKQQAQDCISGKGQQVEAGIQHDTRGIRRHDGKTKSCMSYLQTGHGQQKPIGGPLPRNREDKGSSVPSMQYRTRELQGRPRTTDASCKLSDQVVIWCDLNKEQKAIEKMLNKMGISYSSLYGNTSIDEREKLLTDWRNKKTTVFLSKPVMYGSGINMQQCHTMIFAGIGFKFNSFIQAIHRIYRFLQQKECNIHIIYADTETQVLKTLLEKWENHKKMVERMSELIKENGLSNINMIKKLERSMGCERVEVSGKRYTAVNNDCVEETRLMDSDSVDLIHTSIPFSNHYEYSPSYNDFGHNSNNDAFFKQMDFLTPELLRVLKPGRVAAIHVKDRILFGNVTGYGMPSVDPFHVTCINHYKEHGFIYFGMITVVTDVVRENNQTYRLGWTEQCKDGSKMGVGSPEYILLFRKLPTDTSKAYADEPVVKTKKEYSRARWQIDAHAFWRSSGDRLLNIDEITKYPVDVIAKMFTEYMKNNIYDYEVHVKIGEELDEKGVLPSTFMLLDPGSNHPNVWTDISRMKTLNSEQKRRNMTCHICPANIDWVDRIINRYSNKNDLVYDPFGGIGTIPYRALKLGRRGYSVELNPEYFKDSLKYLNAADNQVSMPTLFDFMKQEVVA